MSPIRTRTSRNLFLLAVILAGGCTSSDNVIGPENEPEVSNQTDTFQWQVSDLSNVTQTFTYTWSNTGEMANVNQSAALTGGNATLTVADGTGTEVYSESLTSNGTFQTATGTSGNWTVTVTLTSATGTLNFRMEKP
jgi:hypothetical protein